MNLRDHDHLCEHTADNRGALGDSLRRSGHAIGVSKTSVGRWCPGGRVPTQAEINALAVIDFGAAWGTFLDEAVKLPLECGAIINAPFIQSVVDAALGGGT